MKNIIMLLLLVLCTMSTTLLAQKSNKDLANAYLDSKGEVIFSFKITDKSELSQITKKLSIVHYDEKNKVVKVMANKFQFSSFLKTKRNFVISSEDNFVGERQMISNFNRKQTVFPLTAYPTYNAYVTMMNEFVTNNPTLCKVENIGATKEGDKSLLFVKLSDNVALNEQEPRVMYTSSMHGDEIAGYPMMLNLIDYLLSAYNDTSHERHEEIKQLLDNNEVWINPLANPDGTFRNSPNNTSVANATRGNANNVDLNRNYPDPEDGTNPDGNVHQTETLAFMKFADSKHFVLSANFHGGIELINYPWDTYAAAHPDEDYFKYVCEEYRDHCQSDSPSGYFDDRNNGITNGFDWYEVQGGRQDYQIYYKKGKEVTIELSNNKTPPANQLVSYWNYNKNALIAFLKQVNYGIRGVVTDAITNEPIEAKVTIVGRAGFDSWTPTELPEGDYYRPIKGGTYDILFEAECYESKTITGVTILDKSMIIQNVELTPLIGIAPVGLSAENITTTTATLGWTATSEATYDVRYRIVGAANWTLESSNTNSITINELTENTEYETQVRSNCGNGSSSPYSSSLLFTTLNGTTITYCTSKGNNVNYEYIDYVSIGGISNSTSANSGYGDFTNMVGIVNYGENTIIVSAGFVNSAYREHFNVWIDYNQNGIFDNSEQIVSSASNASGNQSFDFNVPTAALSGNTRMRVSMKYTSGANSCDTFTYGEVEDYTIDIIGTSFTKTEALNRIKVYPNPIKDGTLFVKGVTNLKTPFRVVNYMGQIVMHDYMFDRKISVNDLSIGMYFLEIKTNEGIVTKRFVISK